MKRLAVVAFVAAFSAGVAVAGLGEPGSLTRPLVLHGAASASPLLGIEYRRSGARLVRLDPRTLRIRPGRRLALRAYSALGWSASPDRRLLALGKQSSTRLTYDTARLRLVDARTLRTARYASLGIVGDVVSTHWPAPDRLLAVVRSREGSSDESVAPLVVDRVVVVDPSTGAVLARHVLPGNVAAVAGTQSALALVLAPERYGPVRLVVARTDGTAAAVTLERIYAGVEETPGSEPRQHGAAVVADPEGARAYVVAAGAPVAEVGLATLALDYHAPTQSVSLLGRLHDWLEPPAQAKMLDGSWRSAAWLGDGRLAVFGREASTYPVGDRLAMRQRPSGLLVIDTRTWSAHMVDPRSSALVVAKNALLSWGWGWDSGTERELATGVGIYDRTGVRRFHLFRGRVMYDVQVVGARAFVRSKTADTRYSVVDVRTGRQVQTIRGREMPQVLSGHGPSFFG
jgi:hypothetical protein